ncbi:MAG: hypothetical protein UT37_C0004G0002 [Parcubacteria group bacterium GW2011_GWA2_39_18]|nr:MAG: hypothetical protein UT37_C0004G0002 [Parcubacteria group bacterium GW2011_GWA2_39_18]
MVQQKLIKNKDISLATEPLMYKPGTEVFVFGPEGEQVRVKVEKGNMGIYVVRKENNDGTYTPIVCTENSMYSIN